MNQRIGRNDPCPCGSGKKYKACHMGAADDPARAAAPTAGVKLPTGEALRQAQMAHQQGDGRRARLLYEEVLRAAPRSADALFGLGVLLGQAGRFDQGIAKLERSLKYGAHAGSVWENVAGQHLAAGRALVAVKAARKALAEGADPLSAGRVLARALERGNDPAEARTVAERTLPHAPRDTFLNLVVARVDLRDGALEAARDRLLPLAEAATEPENRATLWYELGRIHDAAGDVAAAFDAFTRGNGVRRGMPIGREYLAEDVLARVEGYGRLSPRVLGASAGMDLSAGGPAPVFLLGFPRSGTTLTEQVLAACDEVITTDEADLLQPMREALLRDVVPGQDLPDRLEDLDDARLVELRKAYWEAARALGFHPGKGQVLLDKLPLNIVDLPLLARVFPDSKLIVALRDPRDVCLSCFMQDFRLNGAMARFLAPDTTVGYYRAVMGNYVAQRDHLPQARIEVRYEDTVEDLEREARRLLEHLGLPWRDGVLAFHERARERSISTPSYAGVSRPIYDSAAGRWRRYEALVGQAFAPLGELAAVFGYAD